MRMPREGRAAKPHLGYVCRLGIPGGTIMPVSDKWSDRWKVFAHWRDTTVPGVLLAHSVLFLFTGVLYRLTYEGLHRILPPCEIWTGAIGVIEGGTMALIFLLLSYDVLRILWNRVHRGAVGHDLSSLLLVSAL